MMLKGPHLSWVPRNEMPVEPRPRAVWILNKLSLDLQGARMWPVRLAHLKHQDALCNLLTHSPHFRFWIQFQCANVFYLGNHVLSIMEYG